ncbi:unnamed protein product [Rhizophagus irregularis]|nr:unnamed protein product [Rhizophagus irregularis]
MVEFHQHCIESFNKYWDKFDSKIYILAYFLHPAYCARGLKAVYWKTITTTAAQIWQNNSGDRRSCNHLLAQMRNYELRKSPYNQEFDSHLETPMSWWLTIKDKRNIPISEIPNHEVRVLIIEEMFNLKNAVKCLNNNGENLDDSDINDDVNKTDGEDELDDSENVEMESNYDGEELIQQYSLDNELEGYTL